jgi:hypothetical protein
MSDTPMKLIVDVAKGTHEYVALTPAEIAERDQMAAQHAAEEAEREAKAQAEADAKLAAQAKLAALGLTGEEVAAITK